MIDKETYERISNKYGHYASWAVWAPEGQKSKSNVGDLTIFDANPTLLEKLNPDTVMVGLNISRPIEYKFGNFHDRRPQSQDYKIRYAFKDTDFYGAYMTDIIKDFENVTSGDVMTFLKRNQDFEKKNIEIFLEELNDIGSKNTLIIAFGNHAFNILDKNFRNKFQILKVPHYSMQISKEDYKTRVTGLTVNTK